MKIMTILGTRPEIIRLSLIVSKLDKISDHILVHTGQNYSKLLSDIFFDELGIRRPNYHFDIEEHCFGHQLGRMFCEIETLLLNEKPDKVLILGDTNSGLLSIIAERMSIPVYHMEAGNRCFDLKVPEEKNRRLIDSISSYALPYTPGSRENLLLEGLPKQRIFLSGNPIFEVLNHYSGKIEGSRILEELNISKNNYLLATIHRSENVDNFERLEQIISAIDLIQRENGFEVIFSVHPRTRQKLETFGIVNSNRNILYCEPFGFFDFVKLEKNARVVLTDSGTVQEECCVFNIPTVTVRDTTERPETVECGSNIVSGINTERIVECTKRMMKSNCQWEYPTGYIDKNVSDKVINFILSN
ncbi:MAG: UDP-N-acetylglucosamine 2-epimerase (non-hydrolyzing) [Clostridiaceae bacterium]|jgi:UDP-N-acetylglucosamine 2-epimerase (non-hydrolysing)|nr:UDP-N-acetylglucosamine 2-epimerase (non-hydrolyzing) [Clostridiaceae bacterium]